MHQGKLLQSAISEYKSLASLTASKTETNSCSKKLIRELRRDHDWTDGGARAMVMLANDYGTFMLRNALALAVALEKEDGDLDY